jgi:E3 ubiquitin-protein ligase RNF13/E3 ubiquitin-protein ligase RNF167
MVFGLLCFPYVVALAYFTIARPLGSHHNPIFTAKSERSWLWGWTWGTESTVSVIDHNPVVSFPSRPAAFGGEINDPLLGYIIPVSVFTQQCPGNTTSFLPENSGCPDLCVTTPNQPTEPWIALVQRGKCEFVKKVREAQRLGAKAVVVGGEDPEISGYPDTLVNMYSPEDSSDVIIPSTYIKYSDYLQLHALIAASNTTHSGFSTLSLLITAEYSAWEWYSPIITFVIILLLPSVLTFITLLIHRIRAVRAAQRDRAPEDIVRNLPWQVWTGTHWEKHEGGEDPNALSEALSAGVDLEDGLPTQKSSAVLEDASTSLPAPSPNQPWFEAQLECAICLSEYAKGDKVRVLPCHHIFHLSEVDEWLIQRKKLCPVCKADVTQPPHGSDHGPVVSHHSPERNSVLQPTPTPTATERTPLLSTNDTHDRRL